MTSYYVGVATEDAKGATLIELLTALRRAAGCSHLLGPISITCSSRDSLDSVACLLRDCGDAFAVHVLHSDLSGIERDVVLASFRQAQARQTQQPRGGDSVSADGNQEVALPPSSIDADQCPQGHGYPSPVLVATDFALPDSGSMSCAPGRVPLLVSYDLPSKKEVLQKRILSAFGPRDKRVAGYSSAAAVHFVVAGEAPAFRSLERFTLPGLIHEMPVHVADVLQNARNRL